MSLSRISIGLGVAIALQLLVLSGMVVKAAMPLWTGTEIRVKTVPVDPRSMFRGNYAQLNYDIGQLPADVFPDVTILRIGEVVYVSLELTEGGLYGVESASLDKPAEGVFLRGRIASYPQPYRVKYGIEAFFAPKEKALQLEQDLRNGGVAVLMVDDNGRVALSDVVPNTSAE
jgi:uncharacterized membrane-anchored protein